MSWFKTRLIGAAIALPIAFIAYSMRKSDDGEQFRKVAHQLVAHVDGYDSKKEYLDGLADFAHDQVFDSSYHYEPGGRFRSGHSWVDGDKYVHDLFSAMENQAMEDHQPGLVTAMKKYVQEQIDAPEAPRPRDAAAAKGKTGR